MMLPRAPRSTKTQLAASERVQTEVIAALREEGCNAVAERAARCQHERQRHGLWPWRCRGAGSCWNCHRAQARRWWRGFDLWLSGPTTSLVVIPLEGNLIDAVKRMRKGVRDVRDRAGRTRPAWRQVAMAGLADGRSMYLLIRHDGISQTGVWTVISRRWPDAVLRAEPSFEPVALLSVGDAVALAKRRRGIEALRVILPPQRDLEAGRSYRSVPVEPMPMAF